VKKELKSASMFSFLPSRMACLESNKLELIKQLDTLQAIHEKLKKQRGSKFALQKFEKVVTNNSGTT
jgi:hypothetical protein